MSRYGDKHQHTAECAVRTCDQPGVTLKIQFGQLDWWCEQHDNLDQTDQRSA